MEIYNKKENRRNTGYFDQNGKEILEGDILTNIFEERFVVTYKERCAQYESIIVEGKENFKSVIKPGWVDVHFKWNSIVECNLIPISKTIDKKIIGNIYDDIHLINEYLYKGKWHPLLSNTLSHLVIE